MGLLLSLFLLFTGGARAQEVVATRVVALIYVDENGKKLQRPDGIFFDRQTQQLYIFERGVPKFIICNPDFFPALGIGKSYGFKNFYDLFVNKTGYIFLTEQTGNGGKIIILSPALIKVKEIPINGFIPNQIAVSPLNGDIFVTGVGKKFVLWLSKDGKLKGYLHPTEEKAGATYDTIVSNVAVDDFGRIYVIALDFGKVYVYDASGNFLFKFGKHGANFGQLSQPAAVAVDDQRRRVFVVDPMRQAVLAYDLSGKFLYEFGGLGWGPGWFNYPTDVAVDSDGNVIVADWLNDRIQVLKPLENVKLHVTPPAAPSNRP